MEHSKNVHLEDESQMWSEKVVDVDPGDDDYCPKADSCPWQIQSPPWVQKTVCEIDGCRHDRREACRSLAEAGQSFAARRSRTQSMDTIADACRVDSICHFDCESDLLQTRRVVANGSWCALQTVMIKVERTAQRASSDQAPN